MARSHYATLAAHMDDEARRMDERAAHYREVAEGLNAKASALRRKANRIRNEGHEKTTARPDDDGPGGSPGRFRGGPLSTERA